MKRSLVLQTVVFAFALAACGPSSNLFVRDASLAKKTKKVVLLPFQWANNRASEDPSYEGGAMTLKFLSYAQETLSGRYEFVPMDAVMAELRKMGFQGYESGKSKFGQMFVQPTGYTIPQALEIGSKLGADAIFLGETTITQYQPAFAISVRLLDVKTGKVIVAASAASGMGLNFTPWVAPMKKVVERFAREVPE